MTTNIARASYNLEEFQFMIDSFLNKLGCEERLFDSAVLSEKLIGLIGYSEVLERKWKKIKYAAPRTRRDMITEDLTNLVLELEFSMKPDEDVFSWGIRVTQHYIDQLTLQLPYLDRTGYWTYVRALGNLLESVSDVYVRHLLKEVNESEDIYIIGQFTKNQVVGYYKWLRKNPMPDKDKEISKKSTRVCAESTRRTYIWLTALLHLTEAMGNSNIKECAPPNFWTSIISFNAGKTH